MGERGAPGEGFNRTQVRIEGGKAEIFRVSKKLKVPPAKAYKLHHTIAFDAWEPMPEEYRSQKIAWVGGNLSFVGRRTFISRPTLLTVPEVRHYTQKREDTEILIDLRSHSELLLINPMYFDPSEDRSHGAG
ncbi:hypothetical protein K2X83_02660 [Patescibacteria group bacterium]|nr:hypothetical protein [Patescibacteria group bacterium]